MVVLILYSIWPIHVYAGQGTAWIHKISPPQQKCLSLSLACHYLVSLCTCVCVHVCFLPPSVGRWSLLSVVCHWSLYCTLHWWGPCCFVVQGVRIWGSTSYGCCLYLHRNGQLWASASWSTLCGMILAVLIYTITPCCALKGWRMLVYL